MDRILTGLPYIIAGIFQLYEMVIFIYCILSFMPRLYQNPFGQLIVRLVQPFLALIHKALPFLNRQVLDFSPLIALIILQLVQKVIFMVI